MRTIELSAEVNRWDELVAAYRAGETVEIVDAGRAVGRVEPEPRAKIAWNPEDPNAVWEQLLRFRESLPQGGWSMAIRDVRELRES